MTHAGYETQFSLHRRHVSTYDPPDGRLPRCAPSHRGFKPAWFVPPAPRPRPLTSVPSVWSDTLCLGGGVTQGPTGCECANTPWGSCRVLELWAAYFGHFWPPATPCDVSVIQKRGVESAPLLDIVPTHEFLPSFHPPVNSGTLRGRRVTENNLCMLTQARAQRLKGCPWKSASRPRGYSCPPHPPPCSTL